MSAVEAAIAHHSEEIRELMAALSDRVDADTVRRFEARVAELGKARRRALITPCQITLDAPRTHMYDARPFSRAPLKGALPALPEARLPRGSTAL